MHSLDHTRMEWNIEDLLWLDIDHPEFARMAEMWRMVRVGFVGNLPGLLFHRQFLKVPIIHFTRPFTNRQQLLKTLVWLI